MKRNLSTFYLILSFLFFFHCFFLNAEEIEFFKKFEIGSEENIEEMFFKIIDVRADRYGNIFIVDYGNNCIKKFSMNGKFLKEVGRRGQGPNEMNNPMGIDIDQKGNIYLNDYGNRRINVYDKNLNYIRTIKLNKSMSMEDVFIVPEGNLLIFRSARIIRDKYFNLFSIDGVHIRSFYDELHPFVPKMESMKELRNNLLTFVYLPAIANLNQDKTRIAFTHKIPQNPYKIHILDTKGNIIKVIEKKIKGYNPQEQKENFGHIISKNKNKLKNHTVLIMLEDLHFTKENYLVVQRKDELYINGSLDKFLMPIDVFSPDGYLIKEEMKFTEKISSIDSNDNVYTIIEDEQGVSKVVVYALRIKK